MKKDVVSFLVPALNEERNIRDTFETIRMNIPFDKIDYQIVFVDGGSTDRTVPIARFLAETDPHIIIYAEGGIGGFGDAYKKAVALATGDFMMLVPGDNEVSGDAIRAILNETGKADMIIPYFTNQEIRPLFRRILSRTFTRLLNAITGYSLHYYNGTILFRTPLLKGYAIRSRGFAFQAEILIHMLSIGCSSKELGTTIQRRGSGKTKAFSISNLMSMASFMADIVVRYQLGGRRRMPGRPYISERRRWRRAPGGESRLPAVDMPPEINYVAAFLTFACDLKCPYCINNYESQIMERRTMSGAAWVAALNRLRLPHNLPVTLQGGEPSLHKDFYHIIDNLRRDLEIDILTNLQFDIDEFIRRVDPKRINRDRRYQSIRASFHPAEMDIDDIVGRVARLRDAGFNICLSCVNHPQSADAIRTAEAKAAAANITLHKKDFLGFFNGDVHGAYRYPEAIARRAKKTVMCRSTELLISPSLSVHRCTRDVYTNNDAIGHMLSPDFRVAFKHRECPNFGYCNPCDVKVKTDRFLRHGHTSVDIVFLDQRA
jgi:glycosyltransferase involved in cell wall biosynthesis/pyruvate-formate lyase-activating enzyme